jgi:hypothetical protein
MVAPYARTGRMAAGRVGPGPHADALDGRRRARGLPAQAGGHEVEPLRRGDRGEADVAPPGVAVELAG